MYGMTFIIYSTYIVNITVKQYMAGYVCIVIHISMFYMF